MSSPLYDAILQYKKDITSFHMPGHKFGKSFSIDKIPLIHLDVTEVPGLDNLYEAEAVILEAQKKMARKYEAKETIFITNGSTGGILASILSVCKPGDSLIVARNCHHSVWNALILAGVNPIYIFPTYHGDYNILGGVSPLKVRNLLKTYPNVKGMILVSPTYEGLVSDIEQIAHIVHEYNKILIVDEAHGSHFIWDGAFPQSALKCGADIVINSMHKTLPLLTQSALLHIGSSRVDKEDIIASLQMVQTSSPSYVMMALMDYMRDYMEIHQDTLWPSYINNLLKVRERLMSLQKLRILSKDIPLKADIYNIDISKIVIFTTGSHITGIQLGQVLRTEFNIQVESACETHIIAISTIGDEQDSLEKLSHALLKIDSGLKETVSQSERFDIMNGYSEQSKTPRQIHFAQKEYISIAESEGRISASNIMAYPPGIPIICIGEIFSKSMINYIKEHRDTLLGIGNLDKEISVRVSKFN